MSATARSAWVMRPAQTNVVCGYLICDHPLHALGRSRARSGSGGKAAVARRVEYDSEEAVSRAFKLGDRAGA